MALQQVFPVRRLTALAAIVVLLWGPISTAPAASDDDYTDENRPYEFGFVIEGQQHRHEKKDERGIIMGEFGFITADGVYHVTVYATDENGDFKIISMKNIRVSPPLDQMRTAPRTTTAPALAQPPPPPPPPPPPQSPAFATISTTTRRPARLQGVNGCSSCLIPTTPPPPPGIGGELQPPLLTGPAPSAAPVFPGAPQPAGGAGAGAGGVASGIGGGAGGVGGGGSIGGRPQGLPRQPPTGAAPQAGRPFQPQGQQPAPQAGRPFQLQGQQPAIAPPRAPPAVGGGPGQPLSQSPRPGLPAPAVLSGGQPSAPVTQPQSFGRPAGAPPTVGISQRPGVSTAGFDSGAVGGVSGQPVPSREPAREGLPPGVTMQDVMDALLYRFNYTVAYHGHHEEGYRSGDKVGGYFADGRDGVGRNVKYLANEFGYQPNITLVDLRPEQTPTEDSEKNAPLLGYEFEWFY